jgi:hypothetical protein
MRKYRTASLPRSRRALSADRPERARPAHVNTSLRDPVEVVVRDQQTDVRRGKGRVPGKGILDHPGSHFDLFQTVAHAYPLGRCVEMELRIRLLEEPGLNGTQRCVNISGGCP